MLVPPLFSGFQITAKKQNEQKKTDIAENNNNNNKMHYFSPERVENQLGHRRTQKNRADSHGLNPFGAKTKPNQTKPDGNVDWLS